MIDIIDALPQDIDKALELTPSVDIKLKGVKNVCVGGMGGSSISGDILKTMAENHSSIPFYVVRDYNLPEFVDKNTFMVIISYSGNTEETLSLFRQVKGRTKKILCITSNGTLADESEKNDIPLLEIPKGYPPRAAIGFLFFPLLQILIDSRIIKTEEDIISKTAEVLEEEKDTAKSWAEEISGKLKEKLPFIYSTYKYRAVARRWSTQINENSKSLAHWAVFSELDHNEIVGWENPEEILKRSMIFVLQDRNITQRIEKRIEITSELIKDISGEIITVYSAGDSFLPGVFSLIQKGDYLSYYLAKAYKVDPLPVKRIQELKRRLAE